MRNIILFTLIMMIGFSLQAQSTQSNQKKKKEEKKPQWVTKGAQLFNNKKTTPSAQPQVVYKNGQVVSQQPKVYQQPPVNTQQTSVWGQRPVNNGQQPQVYQQPQTNTQQVQVYQQPPVNAQQTTVWGQQPANNVQQPQVYQQPQPNTQQTRAWSQQPRSQAPTNTQMYPRAVVPQAPQPAYNTNMAASFETRAAAIVESQEYMSQGANNALSVDLEGADSKLAKKIWKKFMTEKYSATIKKVKKEQDYLADNINLGFAGFGNTIDVYSRAEDRGAGSKMMVWFDMGGQYLNSAQFPSWYATAQDMMYEYKLEVARTLVRMEIAEEEKQLKKLQSLMKKLQSENDRHHKAIQAAEKRIAQANSDIEKNIADQQSAQEMIAQQIRTIEEVNIKLNQIK